MSVDGEQVSKKRKREDNLHEYAKNVASSSGNIGTIKRPNINNKTDDDQDDDLEAGPSRQLIKQFDENVSYGFRVPVYGTPVNRREFRRAGPYIIGPKLGYSPVDSIVQYLGKHEMSDDFVHLKILMLSNKEQKSEKTIQDERQGKMLTHTEFSLLSMLERQVGVVHHHGLFSDIAMEEDHNDDDRRNAFYTGEINKRLVLVLDCYFAHDFCKESAAMINLQQYLLINKKLAEMKALKIFYEIILVVESLHKKNIIHRDLKLANLVLNRSTNKITIVNFCLGKYLLNENDLLYDQRGSPVYISPDVLSGQPYKGKPSDMWALGVVLFMMFYGQFPFYESTTSALFKKIKSAEYTIPIATEISHESQALIRGLLQLRADSRLTASQIRAKIEVIFAKKPIISCVDQFVPCSASDSQKLLRTKSKKSFTLGSSDQVVPNVCNRGIGQHVNNAIVQKIPQRFSDVQSFLRPNSGILVHRINRDARPLTQNEIGQFHLLLQNNAHAHGETGGSPVANGSNWQLSPRFRTTPSNSSNVTQQMSNLSIRNRSNIGLRGHSILLNELLDNSDANSGTGGDNTNSSPSRGWIPLNEPLQNYSRYLSTVYRCPILRSNLSATGSTGAIAIATDSAYNFITQSQLVPSLTSTSTASSSPMLTNSNANYASVQSLFNAFNEMFIRGQIPVTQTNSLIEFTGVLTDDLATKIAQWLITEFSHHSIVQNVFNDSVENATNKVRDFFSRCGIQMQTVNGAMKVNREQPLELLMVLTYMLQASGYNNTYFVT